MAKKKKKPAIADRKSAKKPVKKLKPKRTRRVKKFELKKKPKPLKKEKKRTLQKIAMKKPLKEIKKETKLEELIHRTKIRVVGIGGGGGSIVSELALKVRRPSFVVANTDARALREAKSGILRFQFGQDLTHGLGTGMNVQLGETAAQNEKEKIKKILTGQDFVIIIACLGGGTGSGASSIFAKISRSLGNITYGIFTLPFRFEGERKMEIAREYLKKLKPCFNSISVIPNERIFQIIDKTTPLQEALSTINKILAEGLGGLIETIYEPGLINIDFADLRTILQGRGKLAYLNTIVVQGPNRIEQALKKLTSNPLYPYTIRGAKGILFNITGEKELQLSEVSQISENISQLVSKEAKIIFGISQDKNYKDKIKVTILAVGCAMPDAGATKKRPRRKRKRIIPVAPPAPPEPTKEKPKQKKKVSGKSGKKTKSKPKAVFTKKEQSSQKSQKQSSVRQAHRETSAGVNIDIRSETKNFGTEPKIRKNAIQIKREVEEQEKEILEKENIWEAPAILRKKQT